MMSLLDYFHLFQLHTLTLKSSLSRSIKCNTIADEFHSINDVAPNVKQILFAQLPIGTHTQSIDMGDTRA